MAAFLAAALGPALSLAAAPPKPLVVLDFEQDGDRMAVRSRKRALLSADVSSHGRRSLKVAVGDYLNLRTRRLGLGRRGDLLRMDVFNASDSPRRLRVELFDDASSKGYWYRYVRGYVLRPGWTTLSFRVSRLARGEKNSQRIKNSFLVPARIRRLDLDFASGTQRGFLYLDHIRFEPDPPMPPVEGLMAFDFGPKNQALRHGFRPSSRELYDPRRGWGWSGSGWPGAVRDYVHPNDLLGDFREARGETFSVRLPNGAYHVRVYFEDHGWWEDQIARFAWRTVRAEGREVVAERRTPAEAAREFYRFADLEPWPGMSVWNAYIRNGRYAPKEFDVEVRDGRLDVRFDADRPMVCRVAALVLWPAAQSKAAAKWCAELDRRMRAEFEVENTYIDTAPRGRTIAELPASVRKAELAVFSAGRLTPTGPGYIPTAAELLSQLELLCFRGEATGAAFSLRAIGRAGPASITAECPPFEVRLFIVQNRIRRLGDGGYTIAPDVLRPLDRIQLEAGRTRQCWLELSAPKSLRPGRYTGRLTVEFAGRKTAVPVAVQVPAFRLPEPGMAFGFFGLLPDYYAPPHALETLLALFRRHGLSSVAGVPLGRVVTRNVAARGAVKVDFTEADRVMNALKAAGFRLRVDTYGGGGLRGVSAAAKKLKWPWIEVFGRAMAQVRDHARTAGWLPVAYSMVDEPHWSDAAVRRAARRVRAARTAAPWLLVNGYWSPRAGNRAHRELMDALGRTTLGRITPGAVRYLKSKGRSIGYYGACSRREFGFKQWAAEQEGFSAHYAWHSHVRYGDPHYDLDGREPDVCMVYYTPTDIRPSLRLKAVRAGVRDYLCLRALAHALNTAPAGPAATRAKLLLDNARIAGNIYRKRRTTPTIRDPDAFRRQVLRAVLELAKERK